MVCMCACAYVYPCMLSVSSCEYWDISPVGPGVTNLPRCDARRKRNGMRDRVERKKKNPQIARDSKICLDYDSAPRSFFTPFSMVSVDDRLSFEAWEMRMKTVVLISFRQKYSEKWRLTPLRRIFGDPERNVLLGEEVYYPSREFLFRVNTWKCTSAWWRGG